MDEFGVLIFNVLCLAPSLYNLALHSNGVEQ